LAWKNILTVRLRALVDRGILALAPASDGSAYQEYVLTPKGRGLFPVLVALRQWSEEFDGAREEIATILVDRKSGRPVRKFEFHARDGRLLGAGDTMLKPTSSSLRAKPSNPESSRSDSLDCLVASLLAMTETKMAGIAPGHFHFVLRLSAAARCRAGAAAARPGHR
jgi:hypothetical protein